MLRELLPVLVAGLVPIAVILLIVFGTAYSLVGWQPPILQTVQFGTANSQNGITAISSDQTGVYAAGFVGHNIVGYSSVTLAYLFVNKYGLDGQQIWSQHFGNPSLSEILGMAVGTEGLYVVGFSNVSSFVSGYYLNDSEMWTSSFGHGANAATGVSVTTNSVYVAGYDNGTTVFLRDYALNGSLIWTQAAGASASETISILAGSDALYLAYAESAPSSTVTGTTLVQKFGLNGTLVWTHTCQCDSAQIIGDSTAIYIAGTTQTAGGLSNGFLGKYDSGGNQMWTEGFSASGFNSIAQIAASADSSGAYVATTTSNARSIVMKYDSNGNRVWSLQLPWETGTSVAITVAGSGVYVGGTLGTPTNTSPAFMAQISDSSSLVFFGVNPPFSFGLLAAPVAVVLLSILQLRRELRKKRRPVSTSRVLSSRKVPADIHRGN